MKSMKLATLIMQLDWWRIKSLFVFQIRCQTCLLINNFIPCCLHIDRMITYVQYLYVLNTYVQLSYIGYLGPMWNHLFFSLQFSSLFTFIQYVQYTDDKNVKRKSLLNGPVVFLSGLAFQFLNHQSILENVKIWLWNKALGNSVWCARNKWVVDRSGKYLILFLTITPQK